MIAFMYGLTADEWLLGESVDEQEFRQRYIQAPQSRRHDLQTTNTGGEGQYAFASSYRIPRLGEVVGDDALRAEETCQS